MASHPDDVAKDEPDDAALVAVPDVQKVADKHGVRFEELVDAAVQAELETGVREETVEEAKAHLAVRVARIVGGTLLILVGLLGFVLPVIPGWILLIVGLGLLAQDVPFARRLLERVRKRMPQDENGKIPRRTIIAMVAMGVLITAVSIGVGIWRLNR